MKLLLFCLLVLHCQWIFPAKGKVQKQGYASSDFAWINDVRQIEDLIESVDDVTKGRLIRNLRQYFFNKSREDRDKQYEELLVFLSRYAKQTTIPSKISYGTDDYFEFVLRFCSGELLRKEISSHKGYSRIHEIALCRDPSLMERYFRYLFYTLPASLQDQLCDEIRHFQEFFQENELSIRYIFSYGLNSPYQNTKFFILKLFIEKDPDLDLDLDLNPESFKKFLKELLEFYKEEKDEKLKKNILLFLCKLLVKFSNEASKQPQIDCKTLMQLVCQIFYEEISSLQEAEVQAAVAGVIAILERRGIRLSEMRDPIPANDEESINNGESSSSSQDQGSREESSNRERSSYESFPDRPEEQGSLETGVQIISQGLASLSTFATQSLRSVLPSPVSRSLSSTVLPVRTLSDGLPRARSVASTLYFADHFGWGCY